MPEIIALMVGAVALIFISFIFGHQVVRRYSTEAVLSAWRAKRPLNARQRAILVDYYRDRYAITGDPDDLDNKIRAETEQ
jgi:hypothetical protein